MDLIILGTGGHAKVASQVFFENEENRILGYVDFQKNWVPDHLWLGSDSELEKIYKKGARNAFVAIGNNNIRNNLLSRLKEIGFNLPCIISRAAYVAPSAIVREGSLIMPGAVVNASTTIGRGAIINTNASVDHDCIIGDSVHIAPGVSLAGGVSVGRETFIGVGSSVRDHVIIGHNSLIGAGTVVVDNLDSGFIYYGVPAKKVKRNETR